jgi:hypothetical protein
MSFLSILHESPLQQSGFAAAPADAVVVVAPSSFFIGHESPLQQQHESIAQQASGFF